MDKLYIQRRVASQNKSKVFEIMLKCKCIRRLFPLIPYLVEKEKGLIQMFW